MSPKHYHRPGFAFARVAAGEPDGDGLGASRGFGSGHSIVRTRMHTRRTMRPSLTTADSHKQTFLTPPDNIRFREKSRHDSFALDHRLKALTGTPWHPPRHPLRCVVRLHRPHSLLFVCFHLVDK